MRVRANTQTTANTLVAMLLVDAGLDGRNADAAEVHKVELTHDHGVMLVWPDGHSLQVSDTNREAVRLAAEQLANGVGLCV